MKKIFINLIVILLAVVLIGCSSSNTTERSAEMYVEIRQIGTIDGQTRVEYNTNSWAMMVVDSDRNLFKKSVKLFKQLGLDYTDMSGEEFVNLSNLFEATTKSKTEGLSKGDIVTFEIQAKPGLGISTEEACSSLDIKFEPFDYIVD